MAMTYNYTLRRAGFSVAEVLGVALTDATAMPSATGTTTSGNDTVSGTTATTAFAEADVVDVRGAAQKFAQLVRSKTTNTIRLATIYLTTASESVTVTKMDEIPFYFDAPFCAKAVDWIDVTNGIEWRWRDGMSIGVADKYVRATGVTTRETGSGLVVFTNRICLAPTVAPINSRFEFSVRG